MHRHTRRHADDTNVIVDRADGASNVRAMRPAVGIPPACARIIIASDISPIEVLVITTGFTRRAGNTGINDADLLSGLQRQLIGLGLVIAVGYDLFGIWTACTVIVYRQGEAFRVDLKRDKTSLAAQCTLTFFVKLNREPTPALRLYGMA